MLHKKIYTHIDFYDLLEEVEKIGDEDFEANFMDVYQPSSDCSIKVSIPSDSELKEYDWDEWQLEMFSVLRENGFHPEDSIYIDIGY